MKLWRGIDARKVITAVDVDGLALVTAPWVRPEACVRCGLPTTARFHEYGTAKLYPVHAECARVTRRELVAA